MEHEVNETIEDLTQVPPLCREWSDLLARYVDGWAQMKSFQSDLDLEIESLLAWAKYLEGYRSRPTVPPDGENGLLHTKESLKHAWANMARIYQDTPKELRVILVWPDFSKAEVS